MTFVEENEWTQHLKNNSTMKPNNNMQASLAIGHHKYG